MKSTKKRRSHNKKRKIEKETEERERCNSSKEDKTDLWWNKEFQFSKKDECAHDEKSANKKDSLSSLCESSQEVIKHKNDLKEWLMPTTKISSKNFKIENYITIMFCIQ